MGVPISLKDTVQSSRILLLVLLSLHCVLLESLYLKKNSQQFGDMVVYWIIYGGVLELMKKIMKIGSVNHKKYIHSNIFNVEVVALAVSYDIGYMENT